MATFQIEIKTPAAAITREVEVYNLRMAWQAIDLSDAAVITRHPLPDGGIVATITNYAGERRTVTIR